MSTPDRLPTGSERETVDQRMRDLHDRLKAAGNVSDAQIVDDAVWAIETLETDVAWAAAKRAALSVKREPTHVVRGLSGHVAGFERSHHDAGMMVPLGGELWRLPPGRYRVYPDADTPLAASPPEAVEPEGDERP